MKRLIILLVLVAAIISCGKKEATESKNMEQIYTEEGIPVKTITIQQEKFDLELSFTTTLSGLKQSYVTAMMGGRIDKIHVKVGDYVEQDQVIMEFPEDAPSGNYSQAKSAFELAQSTYQKMEKVFKAGGISQLEFEQVRTQYEVSKANFDAVSQMLKVRASINGYVTNITVRETDSASAEDVLATIAQTDKLKAKIWVTEDEITQIAINNQATATWNGVTLRGKVTEVGMAIEPGTNAFGIDLVFDNAAKACKAGVISEIKILTYSNPTAFVVERKNVMSDAQGRYVFVLTGDVAKKQYVETGKENGSFEILSGLNTGDKVISQGLNLVYDGAKVKEAEK